jgi:hypothetical protein
MFRAVGQILIVGVPIIVLLFASGAWRRRLVGAVAIAAPAIALVFVYSALMSSSGGYFGLADGQGWGLYVRAAPIADCSRFDPPPETQVLCETTPPDSRPGPDHYAWNTESPARKAFIGPPFSDDLVGAFGREVLENQPLDYAESVLTDLWRYVDFDAGLDRPDNGAEITRYRFQEFPSKQNTDDPLADYYGPYAYNTTGLGIALGDIQQVVRIHGILILLAVLLAIAGLVLGPPNARFGIALLGGIAFLLMLVPVSAGAFNGRYAIPSEPGLIAAGLLGAWAIALQEPITKLRATLASRNL